MANIIFKRGNSESLKNQEKIDGLLSFTVDDGRIHMDYEDEEGVVQRKTLYSGRLYFGDDKSQYYDGTSDFTIHTYEGEIE